MADTEACYRIGEMCGTHDQHISRCATSTPAEARTGISDRAAAALADVVELRRAVSSYMLETRGESARDRSFAALDRIERALRAGGAA